jgi:hypothetical protein
MAKKIIAKSRKGGYIVSGEKNPQDKKTIANNIKSGQHYFVKKETNEVIVQKSAKSSTYIRARPDETTTDNLSSLGYLDGDSSVGKKTSKTAIVSKSNNNNNTKKTTAIVPTSKTKKISKTTVVNKTSNNDNTKKTTAIGKTNNDKKENKKSNEKSDVNVRLLIIACFVVTICTAIAVLIIIL